MMLAGIPVPASATAELSDLLRTVGVVAGVPIALVEAVDVSVEAEHVELAVGSLPE